MSPSPESILSAVAAVFGVPREVILGRRRLRCFCEARHAAALLLREEAGLSYPRIGRVLGRDHSTAHHSVQKAHDWRRDRPGFAARLDAAQQRAWMGPR